MLLKDYVHTIPSQKRDRITNLKAEFFKLHSYYPEFYVRTPGRVNLIGEHIDYSGYGVLPMAIDKDIIVAVAKRIDNVLNLGNIDSQTYASIVIKLDPGCFTVLDNTNSMQLKTRNIIDQIKIDSDSPKWHDYFLAGFKGALDKVLKIKDGLSPIGLSILISSNLPACSGLSSSSALVCAATLSTLFAHGFCLDRLEMAELCALNERYIGTVGGGMDQAICFLSKENQATLIEFDPVRTRPVKLPLNYSFVISNSLVHMDKGNTPHYNIRVSECRIGAQIVYHQLKDGDADWRSIKNIHHFQELLGITDLKELARIFSEHLSPKPYNEKEICQLLGLQNRHDFMQYCLKGKFLPDTGLFKVLDRCLHVCNEAQRVLDFEALCSDSLETESRNVEMLGEKEKASKLGELMNASHESCKELFECSHPLLDRLVDVCREKGALGSRLTGAGWGGCCVSLIEKKNVENFIKDVAESFYYKLEGQNSETKMDLENVIFGTEPSYGACIYLNL
ncbi:unnamed protein product [Gordionus sp. m RMFG-2023]|uniref:N-acetylgalactosamine kinase-like n=1 Tax=Gordionus sp. m RMFG-2023 TaxID=3053472 RepID=UPI0030DF2F76